MRPRRFVAFAIAWTAALTVVLAAPAVQNIQVTPVVAEGKVSASFTAPATFDSDAEDIAKSGLLLTFTFGVELRRPSSVWMDRTLSAVTVASTVKFDNLTAVYQVSRLESGRVVSSERTQDVARVRALMTSFERVSLTAREPLEPNAEYYVRVRMQASPKRTFSYWPWAGDAASGRADFTFIR